MGKLIRKSLLFILTGFIFLNVISRLIIDSKYFSKNISYNVSLMAVKKSKRKIASNVLILGDSVARQIFPVVMPNSLAVNGAILMAGHYILAVNAIKKNPNIKYVILMSAPFILSHDFNRKLTYNNFLKPFYTFGNLKYLTSLMKKKINGNILSHLALFPIFKLSPVPQIDFSNKSSKKISPVFSEISIQYMKKLYNFLKKRRIELLIISPPICKKQRVLFLNWKYFKSQISERGLSHILRGYFDNIVYLDKGYFINDRIHLNVRYVRHSREKLMRKLLPERIIIQLEKDKILPLKLYK